MVSKFNHKYLWNLTAILIILLTVVIAQQQYSSIAAQNSRPNFIIILADDLGYGDLSSYGHSKIRTPNLDRMARQGLKLTDCYAGAPVCSPSRAAILTGRVPQREGILDWIPANSSVHLRRNAPTIASLLKSTGYSTAVFGKWHLTGKMDGTQPTPADHGFDYWFATQNNALPTHENPVNFVRNGNEAGEINGYSSTIIINEAIEWLRKRSTNEPFFVYIPFHAPHERVATSDQFVKKYNSLNNDDMAQYYGNVEEMDFEIGRLLRTLDDLKISDNTMVFFTSDNGPETLNRYRNANRSYGSPGRLRGMKLHLYEGGIRVPGIIRWPAVLKGNKTSDEPVRSTDMLPTICELAGIDSAINLKTDGISLVPLLKGGKLNRKDSLYWQYDNAPTSTFNTLPVPKIAIRDGDWKLLSRANFSGYELYNLKSDPSETTDLSEQQQDILSRMSEKLRAMHGEVNTKYNIISIVTDDQAHWSVGAYGNRESRTPNMDRLAREGARFLNAFVATPVCSPSRVGFLTGLYGSQVGITDWISPKEAAEGLGLPDWTTTWPEVLQKNGYRTAIFGKWHLGMQPQYHPTKHGFDYFYGSLAGSFAPMNPTLEVNGKETRLDGPGSDLIVDDAIRFIERHRDDTFAALIHFREPHTPYTPMPEEDTKLFRDIDPTIPMVRGLDAVQVKQWYRDYYASVHAIDRNLGRVLAKLDELGIANNTIVLFTSDHGYNIGHHGIHTKGNGYWIAGGEAGPKRPNMFEESLRVPLIIRWPGIVRPGTEISETVIQLDTFATVLGILGIPMPDGVAQNGTDFSPLLKGQRDKFNRDAFFGQYDLHNGGLAYMRMIRTNEWKLVRHYFADQLDELYDLKNDPGEERNLYNNREYREILDGLQKRLDEWQRSINDPILRDNRR